jgi:hypothetical protein
MSYPDIYQRQGGSGVSAGFTLPTHRPLVLSLVAGTRADGDNGQSIITASFSRARTTPAIRTNPDWSPRLPRLGTALSCPPHPPPSTPLPARLLRMARLSCPRNTPRSIISNKR